MIGKAGLGTPHMDGNTRLCTATAAQALQETFGSDGQPGSYADLDVTDCHPPRRPQHRRARRPCSGCASSTAWPGPNPPKLVVVDPRARRRRRRRPTSTSPRGSAPTSPLLNGLLHLLIEAGHDRPRVHRRSTPSASSSCRRRSRDVPARAGRGDHRRPGRRAARRRPRSSARRRRWCRRVLQGVYQSNQATAAAVPGEQPQPDPRA